MTIPIKCQGGVDFVEVSILYQISNYFFNVLKVGFHVKPVFSILKLLAHGPD